GPPQSQLRPGPLQSGPGPRQTKPQCRGPDASVRSRATQARVRRGALESWRGPGQVPPLRGGRRAISGDAAAGPGQREGTQIPGTGTGAEEIISNCQFPLWDCRWPCPVHNIDQFGRAETVPTIDE